MVFNSKKDRQGDVMQDKTVDTVIGADTEMKGSINSSGIIRIDGKYEGDICTKTDVIIGENGQVIGNISANIVSVSGKVEGNINADNLLEIHSTGTLIGDILVKNISIHEGAMFKGKSTMIADIPCSDAGKEVINEEQLEGEEVKCALE
ncbi:Polymer-forming cytoskeletal [Clostridium thermopalmarium DSM 5974]|uniref:Polymer-forming cytoskeletal n=2 Tax=Clostridium TaxID=1485 RepID=A0A2T0AQ07_9CLOT|nr:polymer-forming cytoskeletal protein [Clostridium thermopalmarium]MBE6044908.1 polymer-forming cytoskeletal protein [Clostridium thermopalmarium]PRR71136.1 Polymer-forming cytoskeletal [Clostridium thermopalmarium DSM 5974]PVZ21004.1 cytoskeletal protein CcmA (bactofilin family) [Clostridium thermopalmarium DSM 5974]